MRQPPLRFLSRAAVVHSPGDLCPGPNIVHPALSLSSSCPFAVDHVIEDVGTDVLGSDDLGCFCGRIAECTKGKACPPALDLTFDPNPGRQKYSFLGDTLQSSPHQYIISLVPVPSTWSLLHEASFYVMLESYIGDVQFIAMTKSTNLSPVLFSVPGQTAYRPLCPL